MNHSREPLLEHIRTTRGEGWRKLWTALYTALGLVAGVLFLDLHWHLRQEQATFFWMYLAITGIIISLTIFGYVVPNFRMGRRFTIRVFDDHIECESPHPTFGPSYNIAFADISLIEHDMSCDGNSWTMITQTGDRVSITPNYGNPVGRIVAIIQATRPDIEVRLIQ